MHQVEEGPANRSYGLHVARLAGVPAETLRQAQRYFARLDKFNIRDDAQHDLFAAAADHHAGVPKATSRGQAIAARLAEVDPDALSPRDALATLYDLRRLLDD
jgi:DNA mismatch repair protein MutS